MPKQSHQRKIARFDGNLPWIFPLKEMSSYPKSKDLQYDHHPHKQIKILPLANLSLTQTIIKRNRNPKRDFLLWMKGTRRGDRF